MSFVWLCVFAFLPRAGAQEVATAEQGEEETLSETEEQEHITDAEEAEEKGIIPRGAVHYSSGPLTPLSDFPEKPARQEAVETLVRAEELWKKNEAEAASDMALEAYDDLMQVPLPRIYKRHSPKVRAARQAQREQIRSERRRAATVYIQSSVAYVERYVKKLKNTPEARAEGRDRLDDLRDVAISYPDLNRLLNQALDNLK